MPRPAHWSDLRKRIAAWRPHAPSEDAAHAALVELLRSSAVDMHHEFWLAFRLWLRQGYPADAVHRLLPTYLAARHGLSSFHLWGTTGSTSRSLALRACMHRMEAHCLEECPWTESTARQFALRRADALNDCGPLRFTSLCHELTLWKHGGPHARVAARVYLRCICNMLDGHCTQRRALSGTPLSSMQFETLPAATLRYLTASAGGACVYRFLGAVDRLLRTTGATIVLHVQAQHRSLYAWKRRRALLSLVQTKRRALPHGGGAAPCV